MSVEIDSSKSMLLTTCNYDRCHSYNDRPAMYDINTGTQIWYDNGDINRNPLLGPAIISKTCIIFMQNGEIISQYSGDIRIQEIAPCSGKYSYKLCDSHNPRDTLFSINGHMINSKREGVFVITSIFNKSTIYCLYVNDKLQICVPKDQYTGEYKQYFPNGKIDIYCFYKDGKYDGEYKQYYPDGKIYIHCFYKDREYNGEYMEYFEDEQINIHCFYEDGVLNGEYKRYYLQEILYIHCFYKNDKIDGEYKQYNQTGTLRIHCNYKDGNIVRDQPKKQCIGANEHVQKNNENSYTAKANATRIISMARNV